MPNTFIVRMKTWDVATDGLVSRVPQALNDNDLILGWSAAEDLIGAQDWDQFNRHLRNAYPDLDNNNYRLGSSAGNLWRFIQEMEPNDFVIVPDAGQFFIGRIRGLARYEASHRDTDTAHRRAVEWLNNRNPIPRGRVSSGLQSRMKVYQTVAYASDFTDEVEELLNLLAGGRLEVPVGAEITQIVQTVLLEKLRNGRMNERLFEKFVAAMMKRVGCSEVRVIPRINDRGADIVADHDGLGVRIAVQVKYHNDPRFRTDRACIDQLEAGMEAESANIGWAVTLGEFDDDAKSRAAELRDRDNLVIRLLDGDELAKLAVEHGIPTRFDEI